MSEGEASGTSGSGRPPLPTKTPSKDPSPSTTSNTAVDTDMKAVTNDPANTANDANNSTTTKSNPLGISPPGMRLRSGKKKKPTPIKAKGTPRRSNRKRRRGDRDSNGNLTGDGTDGESDGYAYGDGDESDTGTEGSDIGMGVGDNVLFPSVKRMRSRALEPTIVEGKILELDINGATDVAVADADADMDEIEIETGTEKDTANKTTDADVNMDNADNDDDSIVAAVTATLEKEAGKLDAFMEQDDDANAIDSKQKDKDRYQETNDAIASIHTASTSLTSPVSNPNNQFRTVDGLSLRLPSQHTPAARKLDVTYGGKNKLKDFYTPAKGLVGNDAEKESGEDSRDKDSSLNGTGTDSEVEGLELKMAKESDVVHEEEERDEGRRDGLYHYIRSNYDKSDSSSRKTAILVAVIVCLHVIMAFGAGGGLFSLVPFWVWGNVSSVASHKVSFYRHLGVFSIPPEPLMPLSRVVDEVVEKIVYHDNEELAEKEKDLVRQRMMIEWWKKRKEAANDLVAQITDEVERADFPSGQRQDELGEYLRIFASKVEKNEAWKEGLIRARTVLQLMKEGTGDEPQDLDDILKTLVHASGNQISLKDLRTISMANVLIPGENCSGQEFILTSEDSGVHYVTEEEIISAKDELEALVTSTFSDIRFDPNLFKPISDWIEGELEKSAAAFNLNTPPDLEDIQIPIPDEPFGINKSFVNTAIEEQFEIVKADRLGKHDYASIRSGASVIYTGRRQTSPSLVENLPLGNQFMATLGLRFYGHGPEAALEPTFPMDSLGQCWSFEKDGARKRVTIKEWSGEHDIENGADRGEYATLAVKLSEPVYVTNIVIEHTPMAVSKNRESAIRKFRVIGFQEDDASGEPWHLGTALYDPLKKPSLQEFDMKSELDNGMTIPMMEAVVLAIDSNWDADYSCLYRFRVHGDLNEIN